MRLFSIRSAEKTILKSCNAVFAVRKTDLKRVHGGIEVGMITGAIPDMDAVGYAPTSRGAHTTEERLYISEVEPYWELMKAVLAEKENG